MNSKRASAVTAPSQRRCGLWLLTGIVIGLGLPYAGDWLAGSTREISVFETFDGAPPSLSVSRAIDGRLIRGKWSGDRAIEWNTHSTKKAEVPIEITYWGSPSQREVRVKEIVRLPRGQSICRIHVRTSSEGIEVSPCMTAIPYHS